MRCVLSVNLQRQCVPGRRYSSAAYGCGSAGSRPGLTAVAAVPLYKEDLSEKLPRLTWANRGFTALP